MLIRINYTLPFFLLFWAVLKVNGQILDDTTKMAYGPGTTQYTYFNEIRDNQFRKYHPDTTTTNFHIFNYVNLAGNKIQNLGNIGTSGMNVFYTVPRIIGRTSGYNSFSYYFLNISDIKLFNTRSPFTHLYSVFGGSNRNILEVSHSQNIKPNWNFGGNFRKLTITKQVSSIGRDDHELNSTAYNGYSYYWTKDSTYFIFGAFSRMNHQQIESGGIVHNDSSSLKDYFNENAEVYLENADSRELKIDYQVYQQLKWKELITIYNETGRTLTTCTFTDTNLEQENEFFKDYLLDTIITHDQGKFRDFRSEFGAKGDWKKAFYNVYYKYRHVNFLHKYLDLKDYRIENYLGGTLRYDNDTTYLLLLSGELMSNGNHRFLTKYKNRLWDLSYLRYMYEPSVIYENYFGNHYEWHKDFIPTQADQIKAIFNFPIKRFHFQPGLEFSMIKNYIFFNRLKAPEQASGFTQLISPQLSIDIKINPYIRWNSTAIYTFSLGNDEARDAFRIPAIFANTRLFYSRILFDGKLDLTAGVDGHFKSAYYAKAYDPVTRQFYLQDDFKIPEYLLLDLYINIRINTVRIFAKWTYFNQRKGFGYFTTPYYIGQSRVIDLGVSWMFYD